MFQLITAVQLAADILKRAGGKMSYLKLLKLMYYADREMLVRRGALITYDTWCAMTHGPVLRSTYSLIKHHMDMNAWTAHIQTQGFEVHLVADPGDDEMSRAVKEIMDEVYQKHGHKEPFDFAFETHHFGDYEASEDTERNAVPIKYREVLEVEGLPFSEIDKILANIDAENEVERILSRVA